MDKTVNSMKVGNIQSYSAYIPKKIQLEWSRLFTKATVWY